MLGRLIKISRPPLWVIGPLLFLAGLYISNASFNMLAVVQLVLLSFPISLYIYGINDICDHESDKLNPRRGTLEGAIVPKTMAPVIFKISLVIAGAFLITSILTGSIVNFIGVGLLLFLGWAYSIPPIRLREKPPLDSITNGLIVFCPFLMGFSFNGSFLQMPLKSLYLILGVIAVHMYATIIDYTPDKKSGSRTFAVLFGKRFTALISVLILFFIYLALNFNPLIDNFFLLCSALFAIVFVYPNERLAMNLFRIAFIIGVLVGIIFFL